jgi:hypothetical protein
MSVGAALEAVIGLVFLFGVIALLCSAVCEAIANLLQMRAKYLLRGLRTMLDSTVTGTTSPLRGGGRRPGRLTGGRDAHA